MSEKYIRNEFGGVHSVDNDEKQADGTTAFDRLHQTSPGGTKLLPAGWTEITEDQARAINPQLFGTPDPLVRRSADDVRKDYEAKRAQAEFDREFGPDADVILDAEVIAPAPKNTRTPKE